jgi:hypothetical protein
VAAAAAREEEHEAEPVESHAALYLKRHAMTERPGFGEISAHGV